MIRTRGQRGVLSLTFDGLCWCIPLSALGADCLLLPLLRLEEVGAIADAISVSNPEAVRGSG